MDDPSTPLWRSPFSSEGEEEKDSKPANQSSPSTQTGKSGKLKADIKEAKEATAHDTPKPEVPTIPEPALATLPSTPEVEVKRCRVPERVEQLGETDGDDDKEYDAGDEEDEELEGAAGGCDEERVGVEKLE